MMPFYLPLRKREISFLSFPNFSIGNPFFLNPVLSPSINSGQALSNGLEMTGVRRDSETRFGMTT